MGSLHSHTLDGNPAPREDAQCLVSVSVLIGMKLSVQWFLLVIYALQTSGADFIFSANHLTGPNTILIQINRTAGGAVHIVLCILSLRLIRGCWMEVMKELLTMGESGCKFKGGNGRSVICCLFNP